MANACHNPAGSATGGQFCNTTSGGGNVGFNLDAESEKWAASLTSQQSQAVKNYTEPDDEAEDSYLAINPILRNSAKTSDPYPQVVSHLDAAIDKYKTPMDITVYRGIVAVPDKIANGKEGSRFFDRTYVSTSLDKKVAEDFSGGGPLLVIHVPKGSSVGPVGKHSNAGAEQEVLLPRASWFELVKKTPQEIVLKMVPYTGDDGPYRKVLDAKRVKKSMNTPVQLEGKVTKLDSKRQLVFGWASVAEVAGKSLVDRQGDVLSEGDMEEMAYKYVSGVRTLGVMHKQVGMGELVESMVFTEEKQKTLGINLGKSAWWVGFKVTDPQVWKRVESGELQAFSIHGKGVREKINA